MVSSKLWISMLIWMTRQTHGHHCPWFRPTSHVAIRRVKKKQVRSIHSFGFLLSRFFSLQPSFWPAPMSSNTFSVWWTPTSTVNIRSASHSVSSRVSVEDLPPSPARSPRSIPTEEPATSPRRRSTRSAISSPSLPVSFRTILEIGVLNFHLYFRLRCPQVVLEQTEMHQGRHLLPGVLQHGWHQTPWRSWAHEEAPQA